jgi:flagellar protein FlaG
MATEMKIQVAMEPRRMSSSTPVQFKAATEGGVPTSTVTAEQKPAVSQGGQVEVKPAELEGAVRDLNDYVQNLQRSLQFNIDEDSGHTIIRVVDANTDEVIRQIPSEEVLALARHIRSMDEGEQGLFLQEKV